MILPTIALIANFVLPPKTATMRFLFSHFAHYIMFAVIEKHRLLAQILLGVVAVTVVAIGGQGIAASGSAYIVRVGDKAITIEQVNQMRRNASAAGQNQTIDQAYQALLHQVLLENAAEQADIGVLTIEQIKQEIMRLPQFQNNGKFDPALFQNYLQNSGMSENDLINIMRTDFLRQSMANTILEGHIISDQQADRLLQLNDAERQLRVLTFPAANQTVPAADDAALKAFYDKNPGRYALPLAVKLEYIELTAAELAKQQNVSEEELQVAYNALSNKPDLAGVRAELEQQIRNRKASQALINERERLSQLAFENGDNLQKVASEMKLPIQQHQEWLTREAAQNSGLPEAVIETLFADETIRSRQNSDVLDMGNGALRVIRITDVQQARQQTFDEVKETVRADYMTEQQREAALTAANQAAGQARAGQAATLNWQVEETVSANALQATLDEAGFIAVAQARPADGKPAYAVVKRPDGAWVVEVRSIKLPENAPSQRVQSRQTLTMAQAANAYGLYMRSLQQSFPVKSGSQRLDSIQE